MTAETKQAVDKAARALEALNDAVLKSAYDPTGGAMPPMDPAMMGGAPPMDPAAGGGAPQVDPAQLEEAISGLVSAFDGIATAVEGLQEEYAQLKQRFAKIEAELTAPGM